MPTAPSDAAQWLGETPPDNPWADLTSDTGAAGSDGYTGTDATRDQPTELTYEKVEDDYNAEPTEEQVDTEQPRRNLPTAEPTAEERDYWVARLQTVEGPPPPPPLVHHPQWKTACQDHGTPRISRCTPRNKHGYGAT